VCCTNKPRRHSSKLTLRATEVEPYEFVGDRLGINLTVCFPSFHGLILHSRRVFVIRVSRVFPPHP
jgi:hypothetical protein